MTTVTQLKRFCIALFALTTISNTHQLCTMEQKSKKASDFQIYQLLSVIKENEPQFLLPTELLQIIAINVSLIMKSKLNRNEKWIRYIFKNPYDMHYIPLEYNLNNNCENDISRSP